MRCVITSTFVGSIIICFFLWWWILSLNAICTLFACINIYVFLHLLLFSYPKYPTLYYYQECVSSNNIDRRIISLINDFISIVLHVLQTGWDLFFCNFMSLNCSFVPLSQCRQTRIHVAIFPALLPPPPPPHPLV